MKAVDLIRELEKEGVRLWEETGDLRFRAPKGVMTEERRTALRERKQAVLECLRSHDHAVTVKPQPGARYDPFPLTEIQTAYLLGRRSVFAYGGVGCHGYGELSFPELDPARLTAAWQTIIRRHEMLRAVIRDDGSQRVLRDVPDYEIPVLDLRGAKPGRVTAEIEKLRAQLDHRVYQPDAWPLFDLRITLTDDGALLHFSIDLLVSDFVSTQLLLEELHDLYFEPDRPLAPLALTFRDYLLAAQDLRASDQYQLDRDYWLRLLESSLPPAPELPVLERNPDQKIRFERWQVSLTPEQWATLLSNAGKRGITASVAVLAAYAETIGRWCRRPQFTLNLTLQNRLPLHPQINRLVGDFTSLELLAIDLNEGRSLLERARALQAHLWEDLDHQLFSGSEVMREISRRQGEDAALFPVVFTSSIGVEIRKGESPRGLGDLVYGITQTPQVWIDCQALESRNGLIINWDTRQGVFPAGVVDDMFAAFERLLGRLASDDSVWDEADLITLPPAQIERRRRANDTGGPLPDFLLHEGVVAQAQRSPDRLAIMASEQSLTFGELLGKAIAVANALRARGVTAHDLVGVMLEKGCDQPVALLGTLLAGCVYVPLEINQPPARRNQIVTDAGIKLALLHSSKADESEWPVGTRFIAVDDLAPAPLPQTLPPRLVGLNDPAYVIYTSGSTGTPKGVVVSHLSAVNTIVDVNRRFDVGPDDRILGLSSLGFDLSVYDIFGPLSVGGCLVLPDHDRRADPSHWAQLIAEHQVTLWNSVPTQMQMLYDYLITNEDRQASLASLRLAMLSGDWIPVTLPDKIHELLPSLRLISLGGATEAAIWSIFHPITDTLPEWRSIPYGLPLTNQSFHVLDTALRSCPDWVAGELYIGGVGLALGYLSDEEKTAERFIRHPVTGERLYRTGDLGRYMPDGSIEFLGREDRQVKIRGHRIELAEVEAALRAHPSVASATVLVDGAQPLERRLVAFVETARQAQSDQSAPDYVQLGELALAAGADLARAANQPGYAQYVTQLDEAALLSMLFALREQGLFSVRTHSQKEILSSVPNRYRRLVRRWIRALRENGLLKYDPATHHYDQARSVDLRLLEETWQRVEELGRGLEDARLVSYLRSSALRLPKLLRSGKDAWQLIYSEHELDFIQTIYRDALFAKWARRVASVTLGQVASWHTGKLRVLELGAGAPLSVEESAALAGYEIDFLVTDPSRLLLEEARQSLGDNSSVRFAVFDPNGHYRDQALQPNSFDVVIAGNVLHRARNIDEALQQLSELLMPSGWLVLFEVTRDHYAIMMSLELMLELDEETGDFTDERQGQDENFLSLAQWQDALSRAGGEVVLCFSEKEGPVERSGMRVLVARFKQDRTLVDANELIAFLSSRLPSYMVPSHVQVLDALPLTANVKIDHKKLRSWIPPGDSPFVVEKDEDRSDLERQLIALWTEVLNVKGIGRDQGFLTLGGDSLLAARLAGRLRESVPEAEGVFFDELLRGILNGATVAEVAAMLTKEQEDIPLGTRGSAVTVRKLGGVGEPVRVLVHDGSGDLATYGCFSDMLAARGTLLGLIVGDAEAYLSISPDSLIERTAEAYVDELIDGGYLSLHLIGSGVGSALAVEIARQLTEAGAIVEHLFLIGGSPPHHHVPTKKMDLAASDIYQHSLRGLSLCDVPAYFGDITILWEPDEPARRDEVIDFWQGVCLGELRIIDTADDYPDGLMKALLGQTVECRLPQWCRDEN